jgi:hypothetical protein
LSLKSKNNFACYSHYFLNNKIIHIIPYDTNENHISPIFCNINNFIVLVISSLDYANITDLDNKQKINVGYIGYIYKIETFLESCFCYCVA